MAPLSRIEPRRPLHLFPGQLSGSAVLEPKPEGHQEQPESRDAREEHEDEETLVRAGLPVSQLGRRAEDTGGDAGREYGVSTARLPISGWRMGAWMR